MYLLYLHRLLDEILEYKLLPEITIIVTRHYGKMIRQMFAL